MRYLIPRKNGPSMAIAKPNVHLSPTPFQKTPILSAGGAVRSPRQLSSLILALTKPNAQVGKLSSYLPGDEPAAHLGAGSRKREKG